jgi:hypothetical protein
MPCHSSPDDLPLLSTIPGPRGPRGDAATPGTAGTPGKSAFGVLTAPFVMPAALGSVTIVLDHTDWCATGQSVYIETAGYFTVTVINSAVSMIVQAQNILSNAVAGTVIVAGKRVTAGGLPQFDGSVLDGYNDRIHALETAPGGSRNYYATSFPSGTGVNLGDLLFRTDEGYKMYRWDGSGWVYANKVLELADFGTGIKPVRTVSVLPPSGAIGDFVILTTDNKIYRGTGTGWTKALSTGELTGQVDAGTFLVDGTIIAQKLGAGSVTADKVGANQIITHAANIGDAVIDDGHISRLSAGKITTGDLQAVNIGYSGRIFHTEGRTITGVAATANATVASGQVTGLAVTSGGSGYTSAPVVTLSGGGGDGARAVANIAHGAVVSLTLVTPGSGYTSAPAVSIAPNYEYHYFRAVEFATASQGEFGFAAGNVLSSAYVHAAPVSAFGPAHPAWTSGTVTACPDSEHKIRIVIQGRLPGHHGLMFLYGRISGGEFFKIAAVSSADSGTATVTIARLLPQTFQPYDYLNLYLAPADGNGLIAAPVTCGMELEVMFSNW